MEFSFGASATKILTTTGFSQLEGGDILMIGVACLMIYLAIWKKFEPLLLLPIGFGCLLANIPMSMMANTDAGGLLNFFYQGVKHEVLPPLIFLGVGALTDFGPLLANPTTLLLGAAAQIGVYITLIGAVLLGFNMHEASAIGIIGGADGPTSIFIASKLAPHLLAPIAVAAYSYMALVPLIQPPIMKLLTTEKERKIKMAQLKPISQTVKIIFPVVVTIVCCLMLPGVTPLLGMLMLGNLFRESGVTARLHETSETHLINIVTILLALAVGSSMTAESFLRLETLKIIVLGLLAFCIATAGGVLFGKLMCKMTGGRVNPLIGSAGVSAVPMAARVSQKVGAETDSSNFLLMHAMGPNVAGVIGSAVAAGVFISLFGDVAALESHAAIADIVGTVEPGIKAAIAQVAGVAESLR
ncbi:MAG: sodium ion-translocating decarboxylase subunit beta [Nitrospinaceae bacterium]|nr:sodium ion-translocating decarboxylase subunit beta [Nitrospinaceae bacterium]